jgi:cellulose synthase (UDP-forming)
MNRFLRRVALFGLLALFTAQTRAVDLGVFDFHHKFDKVPLTYEQIWVFWNDPGDIKAQLRAVDKKDRIPVLSIDCYSIKAIGTDDSLLQDIVAGHYDAIIIKMAKDVSAFGDTTLIRWGPEMDLTNAPSKPWSGKSPEAFIAAYRHFVILFREYAPASYQIWSPVGNWGCEKYYPGDDVVDFTGYSLYELPVASKLWFGHERSFSEWMNEKYPAFAEIGKPIIIAELGIFGRSERQSAWMKEAFASLWRYPLVQAILYYNSRDVVSWKKWGAKGAPSWFIDPAVFVDASHSQISFGNTVNNVPDKVTSEYISLLKFEGKNSALLGLPVIE